MTDMLLGLRAHADPEPTTEAGPPQRQSLTYVARLAADPMSGRAASQHVRASRTAYGMHQDSTTKPVLT